MTWTTAVLTTNQMQKRRQLPWHHHRHHCHHHHHHRKTKNENRKKQKALLATTASSFQLLRWGVLCCFCCCYFVILSSLHNNTIRDDFKKNTRMILTTTAATTKSDQSSSLPSSSSSSSTTRTTPIITATKDSKRSTRLPIRASMEKKEQEEVDGSNNPNNDPQINPKQEQTIQPILHSPQKQQLYQQQANLNLNDDKANGTKSSSSTTTTTTSSSLYWDLSCPLEMSMFSGAHMAGGEKEKGRGQVTTGEDELHINSNDYEYRARKARQEVLSSSSIMSFFHNIKNGKYWKKHDEDTLPSNDDVRRIYFVGDSIMRQIFISVGCLLWNDNADEDEESIEYVVPWFDTDRQVNMNHPNTIGAGYAHSKFEEGRVFLKKDNIELIYHHGIGRVLELQGDDYQNHESPNEGWLKSCYTRRPLTALVPKLLASEHKRHDTTSSTKTITTTNTVQRERLEISTNDVVILNAGVHSTRNSNFQNLGDLFRCKERMATATTPYSKTRTAVSDRKSSSSQSWPQFLYLVTGPSHFPTATGAYDRSLSRDLAAAAAAATIIHASEDLTVNNNTSRTVQKKFQCKDTTNYTVPQVEDVAFCREHNIPLVGLNTLPKQRLNGALHVGSGDCLHWLQPGIPDLVAAEIFQYLLSSSK